MILKTLYNECKKIKKNDELILSFADTIKIKKALKKFLFTPVNPRPVVYKKKKAIKKPIAIKPPTEPITEPDAFDKWMENEPRGYTPGIDAATGSGVQIIKTPKPRKRTGGFKQIAKKDKMVTAKSDMINHIQDLISRGEITLTEYLADPDIYLDKQIIGNYINSPIMRRSITKYFKRMIGL